MQGQHEPNVSVHQRPAIFCSHNHSFPAPAIRGFAADLLAASDVPATSFSETIVLPLAA